MHNEFPDPCRGCMRLHLSERSETESESEDMWQDIKKWLKPLIEEAADKLRGQGHAPMPQVSGSSLKSILRYVPGGGAKGEKVKGVPDIETMPFICFEPDGHAGVKVSWRREQGGERRKAFPMAAFNEAEAESLIQGFLP